MESVHGDRRKIRTWKWRDKIQKMIGVKVLSSKTMRNPKQALLFRISIGTSFFGSMLLWGCMYPHETVWVHLGFQIENHRLPRMVSLTCHCTVKMLHDRTSAYPSFVGLFVRSIRTRALMSNMKTMSWLRKYSVNQRKQMFSVPSAQRIFKHYPNRANRLQGGTIRNCKIGYL